MHAAGDSDTLNLLSLTSITKWCSQGSPRARGLATLVYLVLAVTFGAIAFNKYMDTSGDDQAQGFWRFYLFYGTHEPSRAVEIRLSTVYFVFCMTIAFFCVGVFYTQWAKKMYEGNEYTTRRLQLVPEMVVTSIMSVWIGLPLMGASDLMMIILLSGMCFIFASMAVITILGGSDPQVASVSSSAYCLLFVNAVFIFYFASCYGSAKHENTDANPVSDESYWYGFSICFIQMLHMWVYWLTAFNHSLSGDDLMSTIATAVKNLSGYARLTIAFLAIINEPTRYETNP